MHQPPMESLLDFSRPFDVGLLETTVRCLYDAKHPQHSLAHNVIVALRESVQAWTLVDRILRESQDVQTRFVALQILEDAVRFRWKALPAEQRLGIRNYVTDKLVALSSSMESLEREKVFVSRLNIVLVQILKQEWPQNWPSFIPDLVGAAKTSESLCENNMVILQLLTEEVFDFSKDELTATKTKQMKEALNEQFQLVFSLCDLVLDRGTKPQLLTQTLKTLLRFLSWIPVGFIFQTPLIDRLLNKFFPVQIFRNDALSCLTEIASLTEDASYADVFVRLHNSVVAKLEGGMLPSQVNVAQEYERVKENDREFVQQLALFFGTFFGAHLPLLERPENHASLLNSLQYLLKISEVDNPEVFKICLDAWNRLAIDLYQTECSAARNILIVPQRRPFTHHFGSVPADQEDDYDDGDDAPAIGAAPLNHLSNTMSSPRKMLYASTLSTLRGIMISHMARPEEVLVTTDENNEVVREAVKDTDAIDLYKEMRDTLVYLTHLDVEDTESIMLGRLAEQCDERSGQYSVHNINTLSWAIGSISGAMDEAMEKQFLVAVIKDLLVLCEMKAGKDNKALIASDIMYVVGQYPRFLRMHWKFLRTVVYKLFEFMHELHPGVQDMACDTFLKLTKKCRRKFIQLQSQEQAPFIDQLLVNLDSVTRDLHPHQIHSFYEAVGVILVCHPDADTRHEYLAKLMLSLNAQWARIMSQAQVNIETLHDPNRIKDLLKILRTNVHVAKSTGHTFLPQLGTIYMDMLGVYRTYGEYINTSVAQQGPNVLMFPIVRQMRSVKSEILALVQTFVERSDDAPMVASQIVSSLYSYVLADYERAVWQARDAQVVQLFAAIVAKLKGEMSLSVHHIMASLIAPTLEMISSNFVDFPEHRTHFYELLKQINAHCFVAMWSAPPEVQKRTVDSIVWGFKHTERDIADCGLDILLQLLRNMTGHPEVAQAFYSAFLLSIIQDLLFVLTDRLHKASFKMHATLLREIFALIESGMVKVPLFDPSQQPQGMTNPAFLRTYVTNLISSAFPNIAPTHVQQFVLGLLDNRAMDLNAFKQHVRDFLIHLKEFSIEDNAELFAEERQASALAQQQALMAQRMAVPGLLNPHERDDMADL